MPQSSFLRNPNTDTAFHIYDSMVHVYHNTNTYYSENPEIKYQQTELQIFERADFSDTPRTYISASTNLAVYTITDLNRGTSYYYRIRYVSRDLLYWTDWVTGTFIYADSLPSFVDTPSYLYYGNPITLRATGGEPGVLHTLKYNGTSVTSNTVDDDGNLTFTYTPTTGTASSLFEISDFTNNAVYASVVIPSSFGDATAFATNQAIVSTSRSIVDGASFYTYGGTTATFSFTRPQYNVDEYKLSCDSGVGDVLTFGATSANAGSITETANVNFGDVLWWLVGSTVSTPLVFTLTNVTKNVVIGTVNVTKINDDISYTISSEPTTATINDTIQFNVATTGIRDNTTSVGFTLQGINDTTGGIVTIRTGALLNNGGNATDSVRLLLTQAIMTAGYTRILLTLNAQDSAGNFVSDRFHSVDLSVDYRIQFLTIPRLQSTIASNISYTARPSLQYRTTTFSLFEDGNFATSSTTNNLGDGIFSYTPATPGTKRLSIVGANGTVYSTMTVDVYQNVPIITYDASSVNSTTEGGQALIRFKAETPVNSTYTQSYGESVGFSIISASGNNAAADIEAVYVSKNYLGYWTGAALDPTPSITSVGNVITGSAVFDSDGYGELILAFNQDFMTEGDEVYRVEIDSITGNGVSISTTPYNVTVVDTSLDITDRPTTRVDNFEIVRSGIPGAYTYILESGDSDGIVYTNPERISRYRQYRIMLTAPNTVDIPSTSFMFSNMPDRITDVISLETLYNNNGRWRIQLQESTDGTNWIDFTLDIPFEVTIS